MNYIKVTAIVFLIAYSIAGCTKKTIHPVNPELLKHFNYQKGSYWVYVDTVTGTYDSFVVGTTTYVDDGENTKNEIYQKIIIEIKNTTNSDFVMKVGLSDELGFGFDIDSRKIVSSTGPLSYPLTYNSPRPPLTNFYQTFVVSGQNYNNVFYVSSSSDIGRYYINDSVGILKVILYDSAHNINKAWELVRCKIII